MRNAILCIATVLCLTVATTPAAHADLPGAGSLPGGMPKMPKKKDKDKKDKKDKEAEEEEAEETPTDEAAPDGEAPPEEAVPAAEPAVEAAPAPAAPQADPNAELSTNDRTKLGQIKNGMRTKRMSLEYMTDDDAKKMATDKEQEWWHGKVKGFYDSFALVENQLNPESVAVRASIDEFAAFVEQRISEGLAQHEGNVAEAADRKRSEAACLDFRTEIATSTNKKAINRGLLSDLELRPNYMAEVVAISKTVDAACKTEKYQGVGTNTRYCVASRGGDEDPAAWCAAAADWKGILTRKAEASIAGTLRDFETRPIAFGSLQGDMKMTFFQSAVATDDGWRELDSWADMHLTDEWEARYLADIQMVYDALDMNKTATPEMLKPIRDAFAWLRDDAAKTAPTWPMPPGNAKNYTVEYALKGLPVGTKVKRAWLESAEWKVVMNGSLPDRRWVKGYIYHQIPGQPWCMVQEWTMAEKYNVSTGSYIKGNNADNGLSRFQACK